MPDTVKIPTSEYLELLKTKEALTAARAEVERYKKALQRIAVPRIGGKEQQWTAQEALKPERITNPSESEMLNAERLQFNQPPKPNEH